MQANDVRTCCMLQVVWCVDSCCVCVCDCMKGAILHCGNWTGWRGHSSAQWSSGADPAVRSYYTHIFHLHNEKDFDKSRIVPVPGKIV